MRACWIVISMLLLVGCAEHGPVNPSFPLTRSDANKALSEMHRHPKALQRPLVVVGGFADPGVAASKLGNWMIRLTGDERVIGVSLLTCDDFDACADRIIREVDERFKTDDPDQTIEVDVVGISMGGLAARYAAMDRSAGKRRLRIARLYTISTPHQGAIGATIRTWDLKLRAMRKGSTFLARVNDPGVWANYELYSYVRLEDDIVGPENAAPVGKVAWWLPNLPLEGSHLGAALDPRFAADIARRLRGEDPFSSDPPAPLPESKCEE